MSIDNEILQEFLVEAGELYDLLNDQLIELERNPQDKELLNPGSYVWKISATFIDNKVWEGMDDGDGNLKTSGIITLIR